MKREQSKLLVQTRKVAGSALLASLATVLACSAANHGRASDDRIDLEPTGQTQSAVGVGVPVPNVKVAPGKSGKVLYHADINLIFWGPTYADTANETSAFQVGGALQQLAGGAYFSYLNQYGNIGLPRVSNITIENSDPCPPNTATCTILETAITDMISARINASATINSGTPPPTAGSEQIYAVLLRPGVSVKNADWGRHDRACFNGTQPDCSDGTPYYFLWAQNGGILNAFSPTNGPPPLFSLTHELVETLTDPDGAAGYVDAFDAEEIADLCGGVIPPNYAYMVTSYYSQRSLDDTTGLWSTTGPNAGKCVVPTGYNVLNILGADGGWTIISPPGVPVNNVTSGKWGVAATDVNNNVFQWTPGTQTWSVLGGPVSMIAATQDALYATLMDLSVGAFRFVKTDPNCAMPACIPPGWTGIGGLPATLYGGGLGLFATDVGDNNFFQWRLSDQTWVPIGPPGSMFSVGGNDLLRLTWDHQEVGRFVNGAWSTIGGPSAAIYDGAASTIWARTDPVGFTSNPPTEHDDVYTWQGSGTQWLHQGGPGATFAVTSTALFGLAPDLSGVYQSANPKTTNPSWPKVGGPGTRLFRGDSLLATGGGIFIDKTADVCVPLRGVCSSSPDAGAAQTCCPDRVCGPSGACLSRAAVFATVNYDGTLDTAFSSSVASSSKSSTGKYTVSFAGLSRFGGAAQAVAIGSDNNRCEIVDWDPGSSGTSPNEAVQVICFQPGSTTAVVNTRFAVTFVDMIPGPGAHLFADRLSTSSYTPAISYNSTSGTNTITRSSAGVYQVKLASLATSGGNVQVTAVGSKNEYCKTSGWVKSGSDEIVNVLCFSATGAAADSQFSMIFTGDQVVGVSDEGAYAWASNATSASYAPTSLYSYDSSSSACAPGANTASRSGTGTYVMHHSKITATSSVPQVGAYGSDSKYCKVVSVKASGDGVDVATHCYTAAGTASDTFYVESYWTSKTRDPC